MKKKGEKVFFSREKIRYLAKLANLTITEEEAKVLAKDLSETFRFLQRIKKIKTEGIKPTSQVTGQENIFREDKIEPSLSQEEALSGTFTSYQGYFRIKAILEE